MAFDQKPDPKLTELRFGRSLLDIALCYGGLALSYALFKVSPWFLPICFVLSANRLFALSLVSHEAVHYNISRSKRLNDLVGRYLCSFPCFISLSKYRRLHLFHHRAVGVRDWDPDFGIYSLFPVSKRSYVLQQFRDLVTLRTFKKHVDYYTEWPEFKTTFLASRRRNQLGSQSDLFAYTVFVVSLFVLLIATGWIWSYLLIVTIPYVLIVQPYVLIVAGFQHGSDKVLHDEAALRSRTIVDRAWKVGLLLPLDINYHAEHHLAPQVPHYRLKAYSNQLARTDKVWKQTFADSASEIFKT